MKVSMRDRRNATASSFAQPVSAYDLPDRSHDMRPQSGFNRPVPQGLTTQLALGVMPNISGAYMASTRVGGRRKSPDWLRRTI